MALLRRWGLCTATFAAVAVGQASDETTIVDVPGFARLRTTGAVDDVVQALGVPYAEPPVGPRRFAAAEPWRPRAGEVLDATRYGDDCPQYVSPPHVPHPQSEDCLTLNIFAPKRTDKLLPVFFWIHGGGFQNGGGRDYNGTALARRGLVVVTINYRLGALGWYRGHETPSGENGGLHGFLDQILALRWVREHIAAFGGDPSQVTLGGESAGGLSICAHLHLKASQGLFKRAAIESGSCIGPWGVWNGTGAELNSHAFAAGRSLEQLRTAPLNELMANKMAWSMVGPSPDGINLNDTWLDMDLTTRDTELIVGFNSMDSILAMPWVQSAEKDWHWSYPKTVEDYEARLGFGFGAEGVKLYPPPANASEQDLALAYVRANGDICNSCPAHWLAQKADDAGYKVFMYYYSFWPSNDSYRGLACHACELGHIWEEPLPFEYPSYYNATLARDMASYWAAFTTSGKPEVPNVAAWPQYSGKDVASAKYLSFGQDDGGAAAIAAGRGARAEQCQAIGDYVRASPSNLQRAFAFCMGLPLPKPPTQTILI